MKKIEVNTLIFTAFAMCAFAANSVLCRAALGALEIDPASFTAIRLMSGALTLWLCLRVQNKGRQKGSWLGAWALFGYAVLFSVAYLYVNTGTGALILFGSVQLSMIVYAASRGDHLRGIRAVGAAVAVAGLVLLLWPHLETPASILAAISMGLAGVCWGVYSIVGKGSAWPLADTAGNFSRAAVLMTLVWLAVYVLGASGVVLPGEIALREPSPAGVMLALASGCLASGIGYAVWYKVLPALPTTSAASVQLSVPVIAAMAGVLLLDEMVRPTLLLAMVMTLGGVYLVLRGKR